MKLHEYLTAERRSFDELPLSAVDSAVLTQACMIDGGGIVSERPVGGLGGMVIRLKTYLGGRASGARFSDLAGAGLPGSRFTGLDPGNLQQALFELAGNPRFNSLAILDYASVFDEGRRTQFSATTYVWGNEFAYIAFRGTDASLTGWRENFDMSYLPAVPAQRMARAYLESVAGHLPERLFVGGHSKGGNLALFAALTCSAKVRGRIERVWCHDSPGFKPGRFDERDYARLAGRIYRDVPQEAVVGMLLEHLTPERVVRSDAAGIMQHSLFSWEIDGGDFVEAPGLSELAGNVRAISAEWLAEMGEERAAQMVDALFATLAASGLSDVGGLLRDGLPAFWSAFEAAKSVDPDVRAVLNEEFGRLGAITVRRLGHSLKFIPG